MLNIISVVVLFILSGQIVAAEERLTPARPAATLPVEPLKDGWEQIDERMVFLTVQLASTEASIDAVNKQLKVSGYKQQVKKDQANLQRKGNERMDRQGGGPQRWDTFYGRNAEKFFYHPTENHLYHTETILGQKSPSADLSAGEGVASRQGLPVHQRPPQFDYIYRANREAQQRAEAEAAKFSGQIDKLLERRRELEAEQSALWCKVSFRAVAGRDLSSKPLYRFDLKSLNTDPAAQQRLEAVRAAMEFLRISNSLVESAERGVDGDQGRFLAQLQQATTAARAELDRRLLSQESLLLDVGDRKTTLGKLSVVAKRMNDVTKNAAEAYRLAMDGDQTGDEQRKQTFRSLYQESLLNYAATVLAGDECVMELAREWKLTPDVNVPVAEPKVAVPLASSPNTGVDDAADEPVDLLRLIDQKRDAVLGEWKRTDSGIVSPAGVQRARVQIPYHPPREYTLRLRAKRVEGRLNLCIGLLAGEAQFRVSLGGFNGKSWNALEEWDGGGAFQLKDGANRNETTCHDEVFIGGQPAVIEIAVKSDSVTVTCDGKKIIYFAGDFSRLSNSAAWSCPDKKALWLGSWETSYVIEELTITPKAEHPPAVGENAVVVPEGN